jgi:hypothetical protein
MGFLCAALLLDATFVREDRIPTGPYALWAQHRVGTTVEMSIESDFGVKIVMTMTCKLVELKPDRAVLETTTTMNGQAMPSQRLEIPKVIPVPFQPKQTKTKKGWETLTVCGWRVRCSWIETEVEANGMKTTTRVWLSGTVPGGTVKTESKMSGAMRGTTNSWVTRVER